MKKNYTYDDEDEDDDDGHDRSLDEQNSSARNYRDDNDGEA